MLRAEDLFHGTAEPEAVPLPERDPLREPDVLLEAQLLDTRVEVRTSRAALLLELRTTMEFAKGDAALLIAHGVREFTWTAPSRPASSTAWTVLSSAPGASESLFTLDLGLHPDAGLRLTAEHAEFYVADVPRLAPRIPDYGTDDPATIRNNLPSWTSPLSLRGACALS
ncbi:hypothetical protein [Actinocorallia libanotica]|uniref:Uncharacterized protein n=1 Tax=Actinocorallia libanotica TaxID=46162 RepID=A0ABP4CDZ1_9ACTN